MTLRRLWIRLRQPWCRRGAAAIEFVLVVPLLFFIILATVDLGNAAQQSIRLETAARAGAIFAFTFPPDGTGATLTTQQDRIMQQVSGTLSGWDDATIDRPVMSCFCGTTPVGCGSVEEETCTVNGTSTISQRFVTVAVRRSNTPLLLSFLPTLSTLEGRVETRLR